MSAGDAYLLAGTYLLSLRSPASRRAMTASLDIVARALAAAAPTYYPGDPSDAGRDEIAWHNIGFTDATAVAEALRSQGWSPATINRHLAAVRGVVRAGKYAGVIAAHRADHICQVALRNQPRDHDGLDPAGRLVTKDELDTMFSRATARVGNLARRDVAMLAVLARTGMRRSELVGLDVADWRPLTGELLVLRGKGGVKRKTWLTGWSVEALDAWLTVRGAAAGPVFTRVYRGGRIDADRRSLNTQTVYDRLRALAVDAGVEPFAPHDLRRRVATRLLDEGHDVSTVAKVLGHRQITTTAIYDRRDETAAAEAAKDNPVFTDASPSTNAARTASAAPLAQRSWDDDDQSPP